MSASVNAQNATVTRVATSTSSVELRAAGAGGRGCVIHNDSAGVLYVKYGTAASATSFTYRLATQTAVELPQPLYGGVIHGVLDTGTGNAQVSTF